MPNLDRTAASAWAGIGDPQTGYFHSKSQYHRAISQQGRYIKEPGMDEDAKQNEKYFIEKEEKRVFDKLDKRFQELGSDEIKKRWAVDCQIQDATNRGDANAIKRMGGMTSVDEAYTAAQKTMIGVTPSPRRKNA
jgi:hypothetical protein